MRDRYRYLTLREPRIEYLAQAYFHQDHDLEADDPIHIVDKFRQQESPDTVDALRRALEATLATGASESDLAERWLERAGASYDPRDDGFEISAWLRVVIERLRVGTGR
ncbi:contact-dependent growth inhibition system immunity protein [Streptomyces syringium]|uniref:contact-dependent growth inhibition system immunity protein n=1 Tax=Streptomyces syringium TaxID=76729 RepID=UPI00365514EE